MKKRKIKKALELKGYAKEQIEISVQKSRDELEFEHAKLDSTLKTFELTVSEFNRRQKEGLINAQDLDLFYNYFSYLNRQIEEQKQTVTLRLAEVELKQETLVNAHKEKRLFEILYEKITNEETRKKIKVDQKEADFQFLSRRSRR